MKLPINNSKLAILDNAKIYDEKISFGESIHKVWMETNMEEESLSRQYKEEFKLCQRQRLAIILSENQVIVRSFGLKEHVVTKGKPGFRTRYRA